MKYIVNLLLAITLLFTIIGSASAQVTPNGGPTFNYQTNVTSLPIYFSSNTITGTNTIGLCAATSSTLGGWGTTPSGWTVYTGVNLPYNGTSGFPNAILYYKTPLVYCRICL